MIPAQAVEAAAKVMQAKDAREGFGEYPLWEYAEDVTAILEAAAPHVLAGVMALADAWEARGEHDMKVAKSIDDEYIATEILGHGAQMVENARHIRNAIGGTK